jgi:protein-L-isoaspartate(D-aspartate) O-methyltransferase
MSDAAAPTRRGFLLAAAALACSSRNRTAAPGAPVATGTDPYQAARAALVDEQVVRLGVRDRAVLAAVRKVPRHAFVPEAVASQAYEDRPLPIGNEQTISQPSLVALMTEVAAVGPGARVLEIGTGSGYQAAILAEVGAEVYTIEIVEPLARTAAATLGRLGYGRIKTRIGDGYRGWPEAAPFDAIVVTAAPPQVPEPLKRQLKPGGRLVVPVGERMQQLLLITRSFADGGADRWAERSVIPVRFVPMVGEAGGKRHE